jgi:hypothetical protein
MLELGKDYGAAIRLHYEEKRFDEAIDVLRRHQKTVQVRFLGSLYHP